MPSVLQLTTIFASILKPVPLLMGSSGAAYGSGNSYGTVVSNLPISNTRKPNLTGTTLPHASTRPTCSANPQGAYSNWLEYANLSRKAAELKDSAYAHTRFMGHTLRYSFGQNNEILQYFEYLYGRQSLPPRTFKPAPLSIEIKALRMLFNNNIDPQFFQYLQCLDGLSTVTKKSIPGSAQRMNFYQQCYDSNAKAAHLAANMDTKSMFRYEQCIDPSFSRNAETQRLPYITTYLPRHEHIALKPKSLHNTISRLDSFELKQNSPSGSKLNATTDGELIREFPIGKSAFRDLGGLGFALDRGDDRLLHQVYSGLSQLKGLFSAIATNPKPKALESVQNTVANYSSAPIGRIFPLPMVRSSMQTITETLGAPHLATNENLVFALQALQARQNFGPGGPILFSAVTLGVERAFAAVFEGKILNAEVMSLDFLRKFSKLKGSS